MHQSSDDPGLDRPDSGRKFKPMVPVATCYEPTFLPNAIYGMFGRIIPA
jgi:hypothetical protein